MATTFGRESFLDLKFNNHWVSEYGLVVVSDGSRYSETLFPEFEHTTTTVPGKTGTIYWGTTVSGRTITKKLVTDGMTSRQYATFKSHFRPGIYAELRFAETVYKYSYAYISESSEFTFLPFDTQVTISGVNYKDILYKGECDLTFFLPDPYFYSDYYLGKSTVTPIYNYTNQDWFVESGLPLNEWLAKEATIPIHLALGNFYGINSYSNAITYSANDIVLHNSHLYKAVTVTTGNVPPNITYWDIYSTKIMKCYHAGNSIARANLSFQKTYGNYAAEGNFIADLWTTYEIDDIILTMPRVMNDIKKTYEEVSSHSGTWATDKPEVLLYLQENLDSSAAGILRQMVNATGTIIVNGETINLTYATVELLKEAIRLTFISNKTYAFSINGIELQARMRSLSTLTNPITSTTFVINDNIGDSLNNKYITLPASYGAAADGQLTYTVVTSNNFLLEPELYFRNTYE